jgi:hypothetical protein
MKKFLFIPVVLFLALFFSACEKENSFENGGVPGAPVGGGPGTSGGTAAYDYEGGAASCTGAVVSGTFTTGIALGSSNTVVLSVDVDSTGTYTISTNTLNGISFSASGTFDTTGVQTITFTGSGTPTNAGNFNFTPGSDGCTFSVTVTGVPITTSNCKDCLYFPSCVNSRYTFADTLNGTASEFTSTYTSSSDTTIGGVVFQKIGYTTVPSSSASNTVLYYNCSAGVTTLKAYNSVTIISGTTIIESTTRPIKENDPVSASWVDAMTIPGPPDITNEQRFSIVEKGITWVAGGNTFNDVIHVHLSTGSTILGIFTEAATTEYYYAKGIGLIEATSYNVFLGQVFKHQVIKSYFIP